MPQLLADQGNETVGASAEVYGLVGTSTRFLPEPQSCRRSRSAQHRVQRRGMIIGCVLRKGDIELKGTWNVGSASAGPSFPNRSTSP